MDAQRHIHPNMLHTSRDVFVCTFFFLPFFYRSSTGAAALSEELVEVELLELLPLAGAALLPLLRSALAFAFPFAAALSVLGFLAAGSPCSASFFFFLRSAASASLARWRTSSVSNQSSRSSSFCFCTCAQLLSDRAPKLKKVVVELLIGPFFSLREIQSPKTFASWYLSWL